MDPSVYINTFVDISEVRISYCDRKLKKIISPQSPNSAEILQLILN